MACPYGKQFDPNTGCELCKCNPCPLIKCANLCEKTGFAKDPNTGCDTCNCNPDPCPAADCSTIKCAYGFIYENGCNTCKCKQCPLTTCVNTNCSRGFANDPNTGCPTCNCNPDCTKFCQYGYDTRISNTGNVCDCACNANAAPCLTNCASYRKDIYGCQTCQCDVPIDLCPKILCSTLCKSYKVDDKGCPTCTCNSEPCSAVLCTDKCTYGFAADDRGCPSCNCIPCPAVNCSRFCKFGYKVDSSKGCPVCLCNDGPICKSIVCPLDCKYGAIEVNSCPVCSCLGEQKCDCSALPKPSTDKRLCADKVNYQYFTGDCARTPENKCYYVLSKCPIGIEVKVTGDVTTDDVKRIAETLKVPIEDVKVTPATNDKNEKVFRLWVSADALPADSKGEPVKKPEDVKNDVQSDLSSKNAVAFVISDSEPVTTPNASYQIIVSLIGILVVLLI